MKIVCKECNDSGVSEVCSSSLTDFSKARVLLCFYFEFHNPTQTLYFYSQISTLFYLVMTVKLDQDTNYNKIKCLH